MVDWELAVNVTITGIAIVFGMLVLLVLVLTVFGAITGLASKISEKKLQKKREKELAEFIADDEPAQVVSEPVVKTDSNELIAVISAAVASLYSGTNKKPVIKSIKKSAGKRSAWGKAGVQNNTRAF